MEMIDILKSQLLDGMEISDIKKLRNKTQFVFRYEGIEKQSEITHTWVVGKEQDYCRILIKQLVVDIYMNKNQLELAKKWNSGDIWENVDNKSENTKEEMVDIFNKLFDKIEKWEGNNSYLKEEEDYIESKESLLNYIKSI